MLNHANFQVGQSASGASKPTMLMGATLRPLDTVQKLDKPAGTALDAPYGLISLQIPSLPTYDDSKVFKEHNPDLPLEQSGMHPTFSFFQPSTSDKSASGAAQPQKPKARITITPSTRVGGNPNKRQMKLN